MGDAWDELGPMPGSAGDSLEAQRQHWLERTKLPGKQPHHDFKAWPRDVLEHHIARKFEELPWLR